MNRKFVFKPCAILFAVGFTVRAFAVDPPPPLLSEMSVNGSTKGVRFNPYPGAQSYTFFSATNPTGPFSLNTNFFLAPYVTGYTINIITNTPVVVTNYAYEWRLTNVTSPSGFYRIAATPMNSTQMLTATVLNRLAYGPTPDELERVSAIGPDVYIAEQLNMEGIPDNLDPYIIEYTNSIPFDATTNWTFVSITGTMASATFYLFATAPTDAYFDDVQLFPYLYYQQISTNSTNANLLITNRTFSSVSTTNILANGGFESGLSPWTTVAGTSGSGADSSRAHSGNNSLHLVSTVGATSPNNNFVRQIFTNSYLTTNSWGSTITNTYASTDPVTLTYWYLPSPGATEMRLQLGGGLNSTPGGIPATPRWVYATATGTANATGRIYIYLSGAGSCFIDDLKLVAGSAPEVGVNLLVNPGFESGTNSWTYAARYAGSLANATNGHSGAASLQIIGTSGGSASTGASIYQNVATANGQTYTVSFWYLPATPGVNLNVRLDGGALATSPDTDLPGLNLRLNTGLAALGDLRAWFCMRAVSSPRQLFEVLSQFWENHFVTQQSKSVEYFNNLGIDNPVAGWLATDWEFREMKKWRNAMLNPNCTFYDLLKISAESPAMIVYLDSVNSRGNGNNIANENYARELLELFCNGVDNGYDQEDIIRMSRAWTGWSVEIVDAPDLNNPFAAASTTLYPGTNSTVKENTVGVFTFNYKSGNHGTNRGAIFPGKTVPARFGPPWAGMSYQLSIPSTRTGTNSIQDGYDVVAHLANLPFTQEYISVKLCRLFIHDDFPNPTTTTNLPEYAFYDYTDPNRSAEAELVHQCMLAWENSTPKGNLRAVLSTIFNSDLFRSHAATSQKIKTPFEFLASGLRALRTTNTSGALTATTDGYSFATPLNNMGTMLLFDRAAPDGYPEAAEPWISSGTLVERIRYTQAYCMTNGAANRGDAGANLCDPVGLLKKKMSPGNWNNAGAVADYFLGILYPAEGAANLALYRNAAINYLNKNDDGITDSNFSGLGNTSGIYENRVRGMVAMLMTFHRFQEQ